jgi:hypothetical protein
VKANLSIALIALISGGCSTQASPPKDAGAEKRDAGPLPSSWVLAKSQPGKFSANFPCSVQNESALNPWRSGATKAQHAIGCRRSDGVYFMAVRIEYPENSVAGQKNFDSFTRNGVAGSFYLKSTSFKGLAAVESAGEIPSVPVCEHQRMVRAGQDNIVLGLQSMSYTGCKELSKDAQTFYNGLEVLE